MFAAILLMTSIGFTKERKDEAIYETHPDFSGKDRQYLVTDASKIDHPRDIAAYNPLYHTHPIRQDTTNTCWCFCTTSFLETELHRLGRGDIELSRMFTVYWEYVEKVRRFVQQNGEFDGYHFFHQDYIKLKILVFVTHKEAVIDLMKKFVEIEK